MSSRHQDPDGTKYTRRKNVKAIETDVTSKACSCHISSFAHGLCSWRDDNNFFWRFKKDHQLFSICAEWIRSYGLIWRSWKQQGYLYRFWGQRILISVLASCQNRARASYSCLQCSHYYWRSTVRNRGYSQEQQLQAVINDKSGCFMRSNTWLCYNNACIGEMSWKRYIGFAFVEYLAINFWR